MVNNALFTRKQFIFNEIWPNKQCKQYFPYNLYIIGIYRAIIGL